MSRPDDTGLPFSSNGFPHPVDVRRPLISMVLQATWNVGNRNMFDFVALFFSALAIWPPEFFKKPFSRDPSGNPQDRSSRCHTREILGPEDFVIVGPRCSKYWIASSMLVERSLDEVGALMCNDSPLAVSKEHRGTP